MGGLVLRSSRAYGSSPPAVLRRAIELHFRRGYALAEAQLLGLLDPSVPETRLAEFASRRDLRRLQRRLNPAAVESLTEDKVIFQHVCRVAGIQTPTLYAVLARDGPGWSASGSSPRTPSEWADALVRTLPDEFVAKPSDGHFGIGVRMLRRSGEAFTEDGRRFTGAAELYGSLVSGRGVGSMLLQQRLLNHPCIVTASGSSTLQTVRVMTLLDEAGAVVVLGAVFKIVTGDALVDNFCDGRTGNGMAAVDLGTGELGPLVVVQPDGLGCRELDRHPRTEERITGIRLPHWQGALDLVRRAAELFSPIRTVGWDVALTLDGPVLVEGNMWWGPPNETGIMPEIVRALASAAGFT